MSIAKLFTSIPGNLSRAISGASNALMDRKFRMATYVLGGMVGGSYVSNYADIKRNYYGEEEYKKRYGTSLETTSKLLPYLGIGTALSVFTRMDPLSLIERAGKTTGLTKVLTAAYFNVRYPGNRLERMNAMQRISRQPGLGGPTILTGLNFLMAAGASTLLGTMPTAMALGATGAALGIIKMMPSNINKLGMGATMAAGVGAAVYSSKNTPYPAAEGTIVDFRTSEQNTVRKMNFSTAGLVQALHTNRRQ